MAPERDCLGGTVCWHVEFLWSEFVGLGKHLSESQLLFVSIALRCPGSTHISDYDGRTNFGGGGGL